MSTFYLLPPRAVLGQRLIATLGIPPLQVTSCVEVVEALGKTLETTGAFVVYRDDLPQGEEAARALLDGFGAESGDEVIEILPGAPESRRWRFPM